MEVVREIGNKLREKNGQLIHEEKFGNNRLGIWRVQNGGTVLFMTYADDAGCELYIPLTTSIQTKDTLDALEEYCK